MKANTVIDKSHLQSVQQIWQAKTNPRQQSTKRATATWITEDSMFVIAKIKNQFGTPETPWQWQPGETMPLQIKEEIRNFFPDSVLPRRFSTKTQTLHVLYSLLQPLLLKHGIEPKPNLRQHNKTRYSLKYTSIFIRGKAGGWKITTSNKDCQDWLRHTKPKIFQQEYPTVKQAIEAVLRCFEHHTIAEINAVTHQPFWTENGIQYWAKGLFQPHILQAATFNSQSEEKLWEYAQLNL